MFESYLSKDRQPGRRALTIVASIALHGGAVALLVFLSLFYVEELPEPPLMVTFFSAPPPPPPPPPPPAPHRKLQPIRPRVQAPKPEEVQPPDKPPEPTPELEPDGTNDGNGEEGGEAGGEAGGEVGGVAGGLATAKPTPKKRGKPLFVKRQVIERLRLGGEMPVYSPAARMAQVQGVVIVKVCLKTDGTVDRGQTKILKGLEAMNAEVLRKLHTWRYSPYKVDGVATPVCFPVRFVFRLE